MSEMFKAADKAAALKLPVCDSLMLRSSDIPWQDSDAAGFWVKPLIEDEGKGIRTWLMKVDAGAFSEMHGHSEYEQIYVLGGSFYDQDHTYGPGDFIVRAPGALHTAGSEEGALVLLFYSPRQDRAAAETS